MMTSKFKNRKYKEGKFIAGSRYPGTVQSTTKTNTFHAEATECQTILLANAGCVIGKYLLPFSAKTGTCFRQ